MRLMVINSSVRKGQVGEKIQAWTQEVLKDDAELELDIVDLREVDLPLLDEEVNPSNNEGNYANPKGAEWAKRVGKADAFLFITAEYNHGPTAAIKNALDWVYHEWRYKPAGFVSYGGAAAGTRAVQQLKQIFLHLDIYPVHYSVHLRIWGGDVDENGRPLPTYDDNLRKVVADIKDLGQRLSTK